MVRKISKNNIPDKYQSPAQYFCDKLLGPVGKMASMSKSQYLYENPTNIVIFDAILVNKDGESLWNGDLDLTKSHHDLLALQEKIDSFYVFEKEIYSPSKVDLAKASYLYSKTGFRAIKMINLEEDKDGRPKLLKNQVTPVSDFEDKIKLFEKIKIPDIKSIKNPNNESGWVLFKKELTSMYGEEYANKIYKDLYISKRDNDRIDLISKKAILKLFPHFRTAKVRQSVGIDNLSHSCRDFHVDPTWVEYGYGYIPKDLK